MNMNEVMKAPANLRANALPTEGYILSVDGKMKTQYQTRAQAAAAASKLKKSFPMIQVAVYDAAEKTYFPINAEGTPIDDAVPAA
jgi:hypothetical protein